MQVENPYLRPPQVESPQSRSWQQGFLYGFRGPDFSSQTRADIQPEDPATFDEGVLIGQQAAMEGMDLAQPCMNLNVEGPGAGHLALASVPELIMIGGDVVGKHLAGGILSGIMLLFEVALALETFADDPAAALSNGANSLQQQLQAMGFEQACELYIGCGVDLSEAGCELRMTGIFRFEDAATAAAQQIGRSQWLVAKWRTDQSGGATVVASSE